MERNMFATAAQDRQALADLARAYPDTELGKQCRMRLMKLGPDPADEALKQLLSERATAPGRDPATNTTGGEAPHPTEQTALNTQFPSSPQPEPPHSGAAEPRNLLWLYGAGAGVVAALLVALLAKRRRQAAHDV